jgi:hypothetical protein
MFCININIAVYVFIVSKFILLFLKLHKLILHFSVLHNSIIITSLYTVQVEYQIYICAFKL